MGIKWLAAAVLWTLAGAAAAVGQVADVTVFDRVDNRVLPIHRYEGRYYVVGNPGHEYQVRVRNRTGAEVLAVVSVDGVNAVTGETANWEQSGYVLGAHQGFDIRGWRKSLQRVAAFFFTRHENSYAARTGRPDNVGVIGIALFRELERPMPMEDDYLARAEAAPPAAGASADAKASSRPSTREREESRLGTGHGRRLDSGAVYTAFERASETPDEIIRIYYDSRSNLVARGIIPSPGHFASRVPKPFPSTFVPDP